MKSKTSYFNKTLFKKDMTQFWPLWAIEIFLSIIVFVMPLTSSVRTVLENDVKNTLAIPNDIGSEIKEFSVVLSNPFLICALAIVVAVVIFHYTFNSRDMYMIHSFPVKRESLFISHYMSGIIIMIIPYVLGFIGYIAVACAYKTGMAASIMLMAFEVFAMIVLFYSIACAVVMVCGNSMMSIVVYGVINILYIAMYLMFYSLNQMFSYADRGTSITDILGNKFIWLSPVAYALKNVGFKVMPSKRGKYQPNAFEKYVITGSDILPFVGVLVAGILVFAVALMLYKYRRSETVGDMVSFKWCEPVFRTVFAISGGVSFAIAFYTIYFQNETIGYINRMHYQGKGIIYVFIFVLICVSVCYFISEMILRKTFFIWKKFSKTNFAVIFGFMFIILVLETTGVIGVRIPDINNVSSLEISSVNNLLYTDKDDISKFIKINKQIERERTVAKIEDNVCTVQFDYILKDGSRRKFSYGLPSSSGSRVYDIVKCANSSKQKFEALFSRAYQEEDFKLQNVEIDTYEADKTDGGVWHNSYATYEEARKKIYDALKKDIADGNIDVFYLNSASDGNKTYSQIEFRPFVSQIMAEKYKMSDYERNFFYVNSSDVYSVNTLGISQDAENTLAVISDLRNDGMLSESGN